MDHKRLAQLLGMLGSDFDGEILNAARLATKLLKAAGKSWPDILNGHPSPAPLSEEEMKIIWDAGYKQGHAQGLADAKGIRGSNHQIVAQLLAGDYQLNEWEENFLTSISRRGPGELSDKQQAVLDRMVEKFGL